ncbi:hypothetical protein HGRIS_003536 [Hohenbuehelia grisea]|uniref:Uncharacterized protein n=1 Tax=Hohenbuehelia grisea TaxID=104357 RepID=A0ABR3JG89_9AGAR
MSSFTVIRFFALVNGHRERTSRDGKSRWHVIYSTTLSCATGACVDAEVRMYSPSNDVIHSMDSVALISAKVHIPTSGPILLEAYRIVVCPGDPSQESYEDALPDMPAPLVFALGSVIGQSKTHPDGSKSYMMNVSDYVRDQTEQSTVDCLFSTSPRWSTLRLPNESTSTYIIGSCHSFTESRLLRIAVDNIVFLSPQTSASAPASPIKKRKYVGRTGASSGTSSSDAILSSPALSSTQPPSYSAVSPFSISDSTETAASGSGASGSQSSTSASAKSDSTLSMKKNSS